MERIGRYQIERLIGRGGMATVYLARDTSLGRLVALKVLSSTITEPRLIERFQREAQNAAKLQHPHIATVYEAGREGDTLFIAMEYVDGQPFGEWRKQSRPSLTDAVRLIERAARAVDAAHAHGIVHRDLKPANVLVDTRGEPRIVDFGLSRAADSDHALTRSGAVIGTPAYMSPEQVRGEIHKVDARSDVYALGVMLYEVLSGHLPFSPPSTVELYARILQDDPPRLRDVPADLVVIALKAMDKDPARRFASAAAFADDLGRHLAGEPILARPPSSAERLLRAVRRRRVPLAIIVLGAAVAALLALGLARRQSDARSFEDLVRRADGAFAAGDHRAAKELYDRALGVRPDPHAEERSRECARVFERLERRTRELDPHIDAALREIEAATRLYVRDWDREQWDGHLSRALEAIDAVIAADADLSRAHYARGRALFERLRLQPAIDALTRCIGLAPDYRPAYLERARAHLWLSMTKLFAWEGNSEAMNRERAELNRRAEEDLARLGDQPALLEAARRFGARDWAALDAVQEKDLPWEARDQVLLLKAFGLHERGDQARAVETLKAALRERPVNVLARCCLGVSRRQMGDYAGACADLDAVLAVEPGWAYALAHRGFARFLADELPAALQDLDAALAADPAFALAQFGRGTVLMRQHRWRDAADSYTAALEGGVRPWETLHYRGVCRLQLRDPEGAIADFRRWAELRPDNPEPHYLIGMTARSVDDNATARPALDRAIKLDPRHPQALDLRARVRLAAGDAAGAVADWEEALRHAPADWPTRKDIEMNLSRVREKRR